MTATLSTHSFADHDFYGSYRLFASWSEEKDDYVKDEESNPDSRVSPSLGLGADGLYMPAGKLACSNPRYEAKAISPEQVKTSIVDAIGEQVSSAESVIAQSEFCGVELMYINHKFLVVFSSAQLPVLYIKQ